MNLRKNISISLPDSRRRAYPENSQTQNEENVMNSEINDQAPDMDHDTSQNPVSEETSPLEQCRTEVPYCTRCRDVCLGEICSKCGSRAVMTAGTLEQYKQVAQMLLNDRSEWREMLESMIAGT